jgi:hypothetical protein
METSIIIYHESKKHLWRVMDEIENKFTAYSTIMSVQVVAVIRKEIIVEMKDTYIF